MKVFSYTSRLVGPRPKRTMTDARAYGKVKLPRKVQDAFEPASRSHLARAKSG